MKNLITIAVIIDIICLSLILFSPILFKNVCAIIILLSAPIILFGQNLNENTDLKEFEKNQEIEVFEELKQMVNKEKVK